MESSAWACGEVLAHNLVHRICAENKKPGCLTPRLGAASKMRSMVIVHVIKGLEVIHCSCEHSYPHNLCKTSWDSDAARINGIRQKLRQGRISVANQGLAWAVSLLHTMLSTEGVQNPELAGGAAPIPAFRCEKRAWRGAARILRRPI